MGGDDEDDNRWLMMMLITQMVMVMMMKMIIWTMMRMMKRSLPQCCKVLLAGLADSLEQDIDGFTAADLAEYNGHYDCARYLRNVQANVRTPLI